MIKSYALPIGKQTGESYKYLANGWVVGAMAWSDNQRQDNNNATVLAAEKAAELTVKYMPYDYNAVSIKSMLRTVLNGVANQLAEQALLMKVDVACADVQLTIFVYDGQNVIYANAGNGGIVGLSTFGEYITVAMPAQQMYGRTTGLLAGNDYWDIGHSNEEMTSIAVINEAAGRIFFSEHPVSHKYGANVLLCMPFIDPKSMFAGTIEEAVEKAKKLIAENILGETYRENIKNLFCAYGFDKKEDIEAVLLTLGNKAMVESMEQLEPEMMMRVFCDQAKISDINPEPMPFSYYRTDSFNVGHKGIVSESAPIIPKFNGNNDSIKGYAVSLRGKSHEITDLPCQDASDVLILPNGAVVAAAADGVGSAKNAADGSKLAVESFMELFKECCPYHMDPISIKSAVRTGFNAAMGSIIQKASESNEELLSYDTTLMAVIYDGNKAYYGFCGDGGILVLNADGGYHVITAPQKGPDGESVVPLRAGVRRWQIEDMPSDLRSILIVTDGLLDALTPYYPGKEGMVYIPPTMVLMDPSAFDSYEDREDSQTRITHFLKGQLEKEISDDILSRIIHKYLGQNKTSEYILSSVLKSTKMGELIGNVNDDITAVGIIDLLNPVAAQNPDYYAEPDWEAYYREWRKIAYPHLYGNQAKKDNGLPQKTEAEDPVEIEAPEASEATEGHEGSQEAEITAVKQEEATESEDDTAGRENPAKQEIKAEYKEPVSCVTSKQKGKLDVFLEHFAPKKNNIPK